MPVSGSAVEKRWTRLSEDLACKKIMNCPVAEEMLASTTYL